MNSIDAVVCKEKWQIGGGNPKFVVHGKGFTYVHCHSNDLYNSSYESIHKCNAFLLEIVQQTIEPDSPARKACNQLIQAHEVVIGVVSDTSEKAKEVSIRDIWKNSGQAKLKFTPKGPTYIHNHGIHQDAKSCLEFNEHIVSSFRFREPVQECLVKMMNQQGSHNESFTDTWERIFPDIRRVDQDKYVSFMEIAQEIVRPPDWAALIMDDDDVPQNHSDQRGLQSYSEFQPQDYQQIPHYLESSLSQFPQYNPVMPDDTSEGREKVRE